MMFVAGSHLCQAFGTDMLFRDGTFRIEEKEKAAIVGINGAGKSTLLKIIMGELSADTGEVTLARGKTIGYLAQHQDLDSSRTIYEEILQAKADIIRMEAEIRRLEQEMRHAEGEKLSSMMEEYSRLNHEFEYQNGYAYQSEIIGVLKGLGFTEDDFSKKCSALSGGQKTRVSLGKLLLTKPDLILLTSRRTIWI